MSAPAPTTQHAVHVCVACGHQAPIDVHEFTAGARVVDGEVQWFCARHREPAVTGHVWIDCPAAPYYGD